MAQIMNWIFMAILAILGAECLLLMGIYIVKMARDFGLV